MAIFADIRIISESFTKVIVSACKISDSVENLVESSNHCTAAIKAHANELELDAIFECDKNSLTREQRIAEHKAKLADLQETNVDNTTQDTAYPDSV